MSTTAAHSMRFTHANITDRTLRVDDGDKTYVCIPLWAITAVVHEPRMCHLRVMTGDVRWQFTSDSPAVATELYTQLADHLDHG